MYRHNSTYSAYKTSGLGSLHGRKREEPKPYMSADLIQRVISAFTRISDKSPVGVITREAFNEIVPRGLRTQVRNRLSLILDADDSLVVIYKFCARSHDEVSRMKIR